jgi:phenylacetate-CoA ligase
MISEIGQLTALGSLLRHPRATRADVVAFQNVRVRRLVAHAYHRVPYYRALLDRHGIEPGAVRTAGDLGVIPLTDKRALQSAPVEDLVAHGVDPARLIARRTSGSSGEPFTIRRTWLEERLLGLFRLRAMHQLGVRPRDRRVNVVRIRAVDPVDHQLPQRVLQAMGLYREAGVDCLLEPAEIIEAVRRLHPDVLVGFPGVLSRVASRVSDDDRRLIRPRLVVVGGEVLTPVMRRQIADAFRAPVLDVYGSHEFNLLAWQCRDTGELHVCDDSVVLEVLKDGRPAAVGERGEVVATSLHSLAMPFIRYRLGDLVTRGVDACPCGQPFSVIGAVQGRMIDYFPLPDGRMLHPYEIVSIVVGQAPWIRQYRLLQERVDRIVLQVVPATAPSAADVARLEDGVARLVGRSVSFVVALQSHIALEPGDKFRVSRSLVSSRYDGIDWDRRG